MNEKRYVRYLLDGGFSFGDEQVLPRWSIGDNEDKDSPFTFLEFEDEYKDLCDNIIKVLNEQHEQIQAFKEKLCELGVSDVKYKGKRYDTGLDEWLE